MNETRQFCTFYVDGRMYGIPVGEVQEVIRQQAMTRIPTAPEVICGLINLRGKIVTAIDLRRRLGLEAHEAREGLMNVVVNRGEQIVSFLVDAIGDVVDAREEWYEHVPETIHGKMRALLLGVYKLDGALLHVLDAQKSAQVEEMIGKGLGV